MKLENICWLVTLTSVLAIASLTLHEYFHIWASVIQFGDNGHIYFNFIYGIPVTAYARDITLSPFVKLAGGFFTGIIFICIGYWAYRTKTFSDYYVEFAFTVCGFCHLVYSFWEVTMLGNIPLELYLKCNNVIYVICILIYIIIERKNIKKYIGGDK